MFDTITGIVVPLPSLRAVQIMPDFPDALYNRSIVLLELGKPEEALATLCGNPRRRPVGTEELGFVIVIERDRASKPARHLGVPRQRGVLGPGQRQSPLQLECRERGGSNGDGGNGDGLSREMRIHVVKRYPGRLTDS